LERNVLILRDMPKSTKKEDILTIFDNSECCVPSEVHSDHSPVKDRNNWFCSFKTEEECLKTAKYLQQFGSYNDEKLHVRVKAIHDVKKADASPSMKASLPSSSSNKKSKIEAPAMPYSTGGYYGTYGAYFGGSAGAMDPYFGVNVPVSNGSKKKVEESEVVIEDRTAISDYPGKFDKYSQETFLKIYSEMKADALLIPQSMRGRDFRIVCEDVLVPIVIASENEEKQKQQKKSKKKKKRRNNNNRRREVSGTYYEDDMYGPNGDGGFYDDYGRGGPYYDDDYYYEQGGDENGYYDESGYYVPSSPQQQQRGGGRGRRRGRGRGQHVQKQQYRKYNSRRNGQVKNGSSKPKTKAKSNKAASKSKQNKVRSVKVWTQKGVKSSEEQETKKKKKTEKPSKPKPKKYATSKGVYARKEVVAN